MLQYTFAYLLQLLQYTVHARLSRVDSDCFWDSVGERLLVQCRSSHFDQCQQLTPRRPEQSTVITFLCWCYHYNVLIIFVKKGSLTMALSMTMLLF